MVKIEQQVLKDSLISYTIQHGTVLLAQILDHMSCQNKETLFTFISDNALFYYGNQDERRYFIFNFVL